MKTISYLGMVILLSTAAVQMFARADTPKSESREVLAAEHAGVKAFLDGEVATLDRVIADDYVEMIWEPASGTVAAHWKTQTKQEWLDLVRSGREKYLSVELHNEKVFLHGDVATVLAEYSQRATKDGKDYKETGSEIDTWKRRDGSWQLISSVFP
jgi:ketosteroid isomerase-like protein